MRGRASIQPGLRVSGNAGYIIAGEEVVDGRGSMRVDAGASWAAVREDTRSRSLREKRPGQSFGGHLVIASHYPWHSVEAGDAASVF